MRKRLRKMWKDEKGMGVVEIVLIILVLVGLAILFKNQLTAIANSLFGNLLTDIQAF